MSSPGKTSPKINPSQPLSEKMILVKPIKWKIQGQGKKIQRKMMVNNKPEKE